MANSGSSVNWVSVVGARPQFIKLASICRAICAENRGNRPDTIKHSIIHTGQHYDSNMADVFFWQLGIPEPKHSLHAGAGTHSEQIARMVERLEQVLIREHPDRVIVYGDTNSTLAGALVASRLGFPLAHVEAGCRSYRWSMPEEQNRVLTDHMSDLLLAPSERAVQNLTQEGIGAPHDPRGRQVAMVGDVMLDVLLASLKLIENRAGEALRKWGVQSGEYYLLTLHRAENADSAKRLQSVLDAVQDLPLTVVFPVHPRTLNSLKALSATLPRRNIRLIDPIGYLDMLSLMKHARKVITDSGGVQKEAFYLEVPCVTLRDETEWLETVEAGANLLVGIRRQAILEAVTGPHPPFKKNYAPFGAGKAGERIVRELLEHGTSVELQVTLAGD